MIANNHEPELSRIRTAYTRLQDVKINPTTQYLIGTLINLLFIIVLLMNNISFENLQLPEGAYKENMWKGSDVMTYVKPARNFLSYGIFGKGDIPDYYRTIGYPLYISLMMKLFGNYWLYFTFVLQALLAATIYPILSSIYSIFNDKNNGLNAGLFGFFVVSGAYICSVPFIMTDLIFTILFTSGFYFGLKSIATQKLRYIFYEIILIGYAAQVRPTLILYPIINILVLLAVAKEFGFVKKSGTKNIIIVSSVLLLLLCNLPILRNYINYHLFLPSDVLSENMFNYLGKAVMVNEGKNEEFSKLAKQVEEEKEISKKIKLKNEYGIDIYKKYPLSTVKQLIMNAIGIMGRSHWVNASPYWNISFKDQNDGSHKMLKKNNIIVVIELIFNLIYLIVYIIFFMGILAIVKQKKIFLLSIGLIILMYFLIPTFIVNSAGSRMRLPVEGAIILLSYWELRRILKLN